MVVCKQLGYPGAERHSHSSQFGYGLTKIWMDNVYCVGNEKTVSDCRYILYIKVLSKALEYKVGPYGLLFS